MTQRNRTAVDVNVVAVPIQGFTHRQRLCGKCFVSFDQINVIEWPPGAFQTLERGFYRANSHESRVDTGNGVTRDPGQYRQVERCGFGGAHQHHRRCAIVD